MNNVIPYPRMAETSTKVLAVKHTKYLNTLSKIASDLSPVKSARIAACVVLQNDIVSFGVNEMKSHPFQARYGKNRDAVFLHAETSAIKNALKYISITDLTRCTLYICRVKYTDASKTKFMFGTAKPCPGCFRCINTFDISRVYYTLDNQQCDML
jgi:tRNA(Arg) A34 adenosine deaminase TadA